MGPVLACGDTNAAVDNIVEGLLARGVRVVRIGNPAKVIPQHYSALTQTSPSLSPSPPPPHTHTHCGMPSISLMIPNR